MHMNIRMNESTGRDNFNIEISRQETVFSLSSLDRRLNYKQRPGSGIGLQDGPMTSTPSAPSHPVPDDRNVHSVYAQKPLSNHVAKRRGVEAN